MPFATDAVDDISQSNEANAIGSGLACLNELWQRAASLFSPSILSAISGK